MPLHTENIETVACFLSQEYGEDFPLIELLEYRIGIHHGGLSDDARVLMEWLFELGELDYLVATTTIAQGVNFPVSGVVMASHQYPTNFGPEDMPPEDFWNIAGRAGRVDQGSLGVVALVASSNEIRENLLEFINKQAGELNSALISMVKEAGDWVENLSGIVRRHPEWSSFVQYLSHTYREMGKPEDFISQVELVLRGTFGFGKLRGESPALAERLISGVESYVHYLQEPGQPLSLVDSTGFSLQSVKSVLFEAGKEKINKDDWLSTDIFSEGAGHLERMMGVILNVPELRENLEAVTGGNHPDGDKLARIVSDWVNGSSLKDISDKYFDGDITKCGRNLFGRLSQTASWGMGALLSITGGDLSDEEFENVRNLPSHIYYGVNDKDAVALRLIGVPRSAASKLATYVGGTTGTSLGEVRRRVAALSSSDWNAALNSDLGHVYRKVWNILEGNPA